METSGDITQISEGGGHIPALLGLIWVLNLSNKISQRSVVLFSEITNASPKSVTVSTESATTNISKAVPNSISTDIGATSAWSATTPERDMLTNLTTYSYSDRPTNELNTHYESSPAVDTAQGKKT